MRHALWIIKIISILLQFYLVKFFYLNSFMVDLYFS